MSKSSSPGIEKLEHYLREHTEQDADGHLLLREVAYRRLYAALREVEVEPGEALPEVWLSKVLGISRTPVREALQQLATDGMIQIIQGRAVTAAARSAQEVLDALNVRELLEPQAVKLCAGVISLEKLEQVEALTRVMEEAASQTDRPAWSRADREWHEILCNACPNKLLGQMVMLARSRMYHRGSDELVTAQYLIDGTAEHRQIVEALRVEDGDTAEQIMVTHLHHLGDNIFRRFSRS